MFFVQVGADEIEVELIGVGLGERIATTGEVSRFRPNNNSISLDRLSLKHFSAARGIRCA
jgi:hypothetical protein